MSELDEVKRDLAAVSKRLDKMEKTTRDLEKGVRQLADEVSGLRGTFASIERHLVKMFEWRIEVDRRLAALEAKAS